MVLQYILQITLFYSTSSWRNLNPCQSQSCVCLKPSHPSSSSINVSYSGKLAWGLCSFFLRSPPLLIKKHALFFWMGWPSLSLAVRGAPGESKIRKLLLKTFSWQFVLDSYNIVITHIWRGTSHDTWQGLDKPLVASINSSGLWFQTHQWKRSQAKHSISSRVNKIHENTCRYCDSAFTKKCALALPNCHFIMETVSPIVFAPLWV